MAFPVWLKRGDFPEKNPPAQIDFDTFFFKIKKVLAMLKISGFFYAKSSLRKAESKVTRHIFNKKNICFFEILLMKKVSYLRPNRIQVLRCPSKRSAECNFDRPIGHWGSPFGSLLLVRSSLSLPLPLIVIGFDRPIGHRGSPLGSLSLVLLVPDYNGDQKWIWLLPVKDVWVSFTKHLNSKQTILLFVVDCIETVGI